MTGSTWTFVKASWKGGSEFVVENRNGNRLTLVAKIPEGETPRHFTMVDAFISSLACCTGTNVLFLLDAQGIMPRSFTVKAECVFRHDEPRAFETIHLIFLVSADTDYEVLHNAILRSVTAICPIAVTLGRSVEITWELQMTKK
nr:OsmC family protein [uncultured Methanospirillum sp.]